MSDQGGRILLSSEDMQDLLARSRRIAVLGIKPESRSHKPAHSVARFLQQEGYEIIPVPVYYPEVTEILGQPVYRKLTDIPGDLDMVNVFRKSDDLPPHVPDILAKRPKAVWLQKGIRNDIVAQELARAGITVVQDRCTAVELRRLRRS
ncbi:MAG: CoA-binding protein [Gemmatimonadota bacterium]|nr:MAG: CoA-binding protein [Gemmatimonadota bacterium]